MCSDAIGCFTVQVSQQMNIVWDFAKLYLGYVHVLRLILQA